MYDPLKNANQILQVVRGQKSLWHRTSVPFLKKIFEVGEIRPNDGCYEYSYPQSKNSLSQRLNGISLFDFDTRPVENILDHECKWVSFMHDKQPLTVLIRLDRNKLNPENIIQPWINHDSFKIASTPYGDTYIPMHIPEVEVIHKGTIPIVAFNEFFLVTQLTDFKYITVDHSKNSMNIIESLYLAHLTSP